MKVLDRETFSRVLTFFWKILDGFNSRNHMHFTTECFSREYIYFGRLRLVGQCPMKSLSSVYLSLCLTVRLSLNFLKIGSLVFSDVVHDDS